MLAGCTQEDASGAPVLRVGQACGWGACAADAGAWPEWTLPDDATALRTFGPPYASVSGLTRVPDGWAWSARRGDAHVVEVAGEDAATLRSYALPAGATVGRDALAFDGGALWFTQHAARPPGTNGEDVLVRWRLADDRLTTWPLFGVPGTPWVKSVGAEVLVRTDRVSSGTVAWSFDADGANLRLVTSAHGTADAALDGGIVVRYDLPSADDVSAGIEGGIVLHDLVTGSEHVVATVDAPVVGVWANGGRIAFATSVDGAARLFEVVRAPLAVHELEGGTAPRFTRAGYYFVAQEPGLNQDVRFHSDATGTSGSAFFLPGEHAWTGDDDGVWWLTAPSTDPRFDEAPNPTPFVAALYERS
jgi:hypothetical protein